MIDELTWITDNGWSVFSEGTRLPVVAGGSDDGAAEAPAGDGGAGAAPPAGAEPAAPAADPAPQPAAEVDPFDDQKVATFDRAYVEKIRGQAADYRTRAKAFEEAFDGFDDNDRGTLLELAKTLRTDPAAAAKWMTEQGQALLEQLNAETDDTPPGGTQVDDSERPLTRAELDKWYADQKRQETTTQAAEAIKKEITDSGFDYDGPDGVAILTIANTETNFDVTKAIDVWKGRNQKIIDDYLAGLKNGAAGAAHTPPQTGASREAEQDPGQLGSTSFREHIRQQIAAKAG